jgi:hypothetical protein
MASSFSDAAILRSLDRDRATDSTSNFRYTFSAPLRGRYILSFAMIPATVYPVNSGNNIVYFYENSTDKSATLPVGQYTAASLATQLASSLTTASGGYATYSVTYSGATGKLTTSSTQSFQTRFGAFSANSAALVLGFNAADTASGTSVTAPNLVNVASPISLSVDISGATPVSAFFTKGGFRAGLIIPLNVNFSQYQALSADQFPQLIEFVSGTSNVMVTVTDSGGNSVDLGGAQWELYLRRYGPYPETSHRPG